MVVAITMEVVIEIESGRCVHMEAAQCVGLCGVCVCIVVCLCVCLFICAYVYKMCAYRQRAVTQPSVFGCVPCVCAYLCTHTCVYMYTCVCVCMCPIPTKSDCTAPVCWVVCLLYT
jgi:hypothetical protein